MWRFGRYSQWKKRKLPFLMTPLSFDDSSPLSSQSLRISAKILPCDKTIMLCSRQRGTFFYGTSTIASTLLFSTAIPQVLRFFGTVLVYCWHKVTKTALYFDWNCNLRLVFGHSPLNCTRFIYVFYVVLFYSVYEMSEMTSLRQWLAWINYNNGTTEYRSIFPRYLPWRIISGTEHTTKRRFNFFFAWLPQCSSCKQYWKSVLWRPARHCTDLSAPYLTVLQCLV